MDEVSRAFFDKSFQVEFLKRDGSSFQDFFSEIMEKRYPGSFQRIKPWGKVGDQKNDGYLVGGIKTIFQVYAPNELKEKETIAKIDTDFKGALANWTGKFDKWVFVHNSQHGLSPNVVKKLHDLHQQHSSVQVMSWGREELCKEVFLLSEDQLVSLLGPVPTAKSLTQFGLDDLRPLILALSDGTDASDVDLRAVPPEKLSWNKFSPHLATTLKLGMASSHRVKAFFDKWPDPTLGDKVAARFKERYQALRAAGPATTDDIFWELQAFAAGQQRMDPSKEGAVIAVLAYLFEQCDIFERPEQEAKS